MSASVLQFVISAYGWVSGIISAHLAVVSLLALAFVATMREELPKPFKDWPLCAWWYGWLHDGLKAFINMRTPTPPRMPTIPIGQTPRDHWPPAPIVQPLSTDVPEVKP